MQSINTIEGDFVTVAGNYALVVGRFNSFVVESLLSGAIDTLLRHGIKKEQIDKQIKIVKKRIISFINFITK